MRTVEKLSGVATSVGGTVLTPVKKVDGPAPVQSTTPAVSPQAVEEDQPVQKRGGLPNWIR